MHTEKSCGAVLFRKEKGMLLYLLLHHESGHWDFPKGHQEKGEEEHDTVMREVREETGMGTIRILEGFNSIIRYNFKSRGALVGKAVSFYIAETGSKEVRLSFEHIGFKWLEYNEALKLVTFSNSKELLEKVNAFLLN